MKLRSGKRMFVTEFAMRLQGSNDPDVALMKSLDALEPAGMKLLRKGAQGEEFGPMIFLTRLRALVPVDLMDRDLELRPASGIAEVSNEHDLRN
jgi:hypothetical protein